MKITFWRAVLALVAGPAILWAAPPDKLTTMPQVEQFALGPGGTALPGDGTEYCGPTAMTMNIGWLGLAGHSRLAPTTAAEQTPDFFANLDRTLGGLMQAETYGGTTVSGVVTGVALYMKMKGYEGSFTATTGGIWGPSGNGDGTSGVTIPTWSDLQKVADNTDTALHFGSFLVGWYDVSDTPWAREGGHFLTIVETPADGTVIINNPYPNPGFPIQQTILLSEVPAGTQGNSGGPNYPLGNALNASDGMEYPNGGTMPPGYNTPVIEQWLDFSVGLTPPEVSTWHLDKGQNAISIGLGHQDVLAPVADSAEGASSFDFYGGGELTFTREATYSGGTTVSDSTLASTVTSGMPFGSGKVTLTRATLAVRPGGSGSAVSLALAGGMEFHGGSRLELDRGGNASLVLQTASLARGTNSTLIIAPESDSGSAVLGQDVKFLVTGATPTLSGGMASAAYVGQNTAAGANKSGYFLTYDAANGFVAATTTGGDINSLTGTPIYEASTDQTIASGAAVALTALEVNGAKVSGDAGTSISLGAPDLSNGAGLILNGGEVAAGTVDFGNREAFVYASEAGGVISSALQGGRDVNYFGPGTVRVNGASTITGTTRVLSGTTLLSATGSITGATGVSVSYGATFHQNGTVGSATTAVPLTVGGRRTGVGTIYGDVTVNSTGTFEGGGTVHGNTTVYGVLSNLPDSESPTTAMVFDGDVTLQANALYNWSITNLADLSLNPAITVNGTLSFESGSQLGLLFTNATDPTAGNAFWDTDQVFVLALAQSIDNGSNGDNLELNALRYANGHFYFHIGDFSGTEELRLHWVASPVPEPAIGVLVAFGLGVVAWTRLRRRG